MNYELIRVKKATQKETVLAVSDNPQALVKEIPTKYAYLKKYDFSCLLNNVGCRQIKLVGESPTHDIFIQESKIQIL